MFQLFTYKPGMKSLAPSTCLLGSPRRKGAEEIFKREHDALGSLDFSG